ncbi:MAG: hypothetical protein Q7S40_21000 [Opitutaceae bacterium]|nr:hypothetical protein [Opitutaceae bacterium]
MNAAFPYGPVVLLVAGLILTPPALSAVAEPVRVVAGGWNSNFEQVAKTQKAGVNIQDPQSLGHMYQVKVGDAHHSHEKFVQANKAVNALKDLRKSYNVQGRNIGTVSDRILAGMEAVTKVNEKLKADPNRRDPKAVAEAEQTLRANGFQGLDDFMNKLSSQFESFKNM